ncbi:MAG: IS21 family transposase [Candidatus Melainabacteria bacterium]|nr:IS21 family transposase [Candidatus Melainabacteria bacterium]
MEVFRLHYSCELSYKKISNAVGCSRAAVSDYVARAHKAGLTWPSLLELDEGTIGSLLFPPRERCLNRPLPDWNYIHNELKKQGVTLLLLWSEYRQTYPSGYGLSQFCRLYSVFRRNLNLVMRQEHKAGEKAFSDFAGTPVSITDPQTGNTSHSYLFVCALGASNFTFAQLFSDQSARSWCEGHAAAFQYFGGCPKIVVPDNPKGVVAKVCRYEPDINPSFAHMAAHYRVAVIPARVRRPKDKAKVETAVGIATRWILAPLRNRRFISLEEANTAVRTLLEKMNDHPFKKLDGSRSSLYKSLDKPALSPLPVSKYEYTQFKKATVKSDYHVDFDKHFYSVPHQLRGEIVEIQATLRTIEIFSRGVLVAQHRRSFAKNNASSVVGHRPKSHQLYDEQLPEKIMESAIKLGPATVALFRTIVQRQKYPELGYRSCLGILRLAKKFGETRLEAACQRALANEAVSYTNVKSILACKLDQEGLDTQNTRASYSQEGPLASHCSHSH